MLGEILSRCDPQLRCQDLDKGGHDIATYDRPEQEVTVLCSGLDIGSEIAWIDVSDACDEGRTQEGKNLPEEASPTSAR